MTDEQLNARFDVLETKVAAALDQTEARLIEHMRDMQTELLKAFLPAREEAAARDRALELRQDSIEHRQAIISARLTEIEKRLLIDPPFA